MPLRRSASRSNSPPDSMHSNFAVRVDVEKREQLEGVPLSRAASASSAVDLASDIVSVSSGNPRFEKLTGVVHLYRDVSPVEAASPAWSKLEERGDHLAVLAVRPEMGVSDFCTWTGGYLPSIRNMRFVRRDDSRTSCLVLLRFDAARTAAAFHKEHNDKPFWTMEPDVMCRMLFVKEVQIDDDSARPQPKAPGLPLPNQTELPTCPVCLERLDAHISGIVTTVCNHKFHNECLRQWEETPCPVCRYYIQSEGHHSQCATCAACVDLWMCIICGHVGCGRYRSGHSKEHWKETNHCYAHELETGRVWDYANDGYAHRLILSKTDGKVVEVPSPLPAAREEEPAEAAPSAAEERYNADMHEAVVASKLGGLEAEFNDLLVSQLTEQREWYEARQAKAATEAEAQCDALAAAARHQETTAKAAAATATEAIQRRKALEDKLEKAAAKMHEVAKERDLANALNERLRSNQAVLKARMVADAERAAAAIAQQDAELADLREQLRDLMMFIEGQRIVNEAPADMGLDQGSVGVLDAPPSAASPTKRRSGRKR